MILRDISKEAFRKEILKNNYQIVLYGYGVIGKITAPQYLADLGIRDRLSLIVDADVHKQGKHNDPMWGSVCVYAPETILNIKNKFVILVTGSRYQNIVEYLNKQHELDDINVFILPMMLEKDSISGEETEIYKCSDYRLIPKVIHYCWFGANPIPTRMIKCMESWKKYCPDYEIIRWDEKNYDVKKYLYVKQAYECRRWAFVSDMARLEILYENGGIYFDTDVELVRNLDDLLYQPGFCGVEKWRILNTGGGCGAIRRNSMVGKMLDFRKDISFLHKDNSMNVESSGMYETLPFITEGFNPNNTMQVINDLTVYPSDFFHPYDYMTKKCVISKNTFSIHHFGGSWL